MLRRTIYSSPAIDLPSSSLIGWLGRHTVNLLQECSLLGSQPPLDSPQVINLGSARASSSYGRWARANTPNTDPRHRYNLVEDRTMFHCYLTSNMPTTVLQPPKQIQPCWWHSTLICSIVSNERFTYPLIIRLFFPLKIIFPLFLSRSIVHCLMQTPYFFIFKLHVLTRISFFTEGMVSWKV